ncbi:MAG: hypothetical protein KC493_15730 [Bacteriovoracaceae bacterium]|nr:hypothetical protein [Bacteriovoracaceae bacterium]
MEETINAIVEKIRFEKKQKFSELITKAIYICKDTEKGPRAAHDNVVFKIDTLFAGFPDFINEFGKDKKYEAGVEALSVICEELGVDIDKEECFILFHLRDLGKFRLKESKLHAELKILWRQYKNYELNDQDFSRSLKSLMRMKFINYRKGNLQINKTVLIRYKA